MARSIALLVVSIGLTLLLAGCQSTSDGTAWQRHFSSDIWSQALAEQTQHPEQIVPEVGFLLATPVLAIYDHSLSKDAQSQPVTGGNTTSGDDIALGLGAATLVTGIWSAADGDGGRAIEVGAESLIGTEAATELLKNATHRRRPDNSNSTDSFPSGHSSFSFAASTFLFRTARDDWQEPYRDLAWGIYLPAAYVSIDRVEAQRHFPSDVAAGACLGIFFTNWIYNAHYGEPDGRRPVIYDRPSRSAWVVEPGVSDGRIGMELAFAF